LAILSLDHLLVMMQSGAARIVAMQKARDG
jgi:hypothetical protein